MRPSSFPPIGSPPHRDVFQYWDYPSDGVDRRVHLPLPLKYAGPFMTVMNSPRWWDVDASEFGDDDLLEAAELIEQDHSTGADALRTLARRASEDHALGERVAEAVRWLFVPELFEFWQHRGVHVMPVHYYVPIPDTRQLDESHWHEPPDPTIELDVEGQLALLKRIHDRYREEYNSFPLHASGASRPREYYVKNGFFESVDGEVLYSIIRDRRPDRVIEVGSGFSTWLIAEALKRNDDDATHTVVDPHPGFVREAFPDIEIIPERVQDIPLSLFESLASDDVFFIDSSHVLTIESDVRYEYLEVVPALSEGVLIHLHDIFLPREYPREWITTKRWFWNEQYLAKALLLFNDALNVVWSSHHMHRTYPDLLAEAFESYAAIGAEYEHKEIHGIPSSFWIEKRDKYY